MLIVLDEGIIPYPKDTIGLVPLLVPLFTRSKWWGRWWMTGRDDGEDEGKMVAGGDISILFITLTTACQTVAHLLLRANDLFLPFSYFIIYFKISENLCRSQEIVQQGDNIPTLYMIHIQFLSPHGP